MLPGLFVAPVAWISILVAIVVFTALTLYLSRTHIGMAMRALSENPDLIRVFGLDPGARGAIRVRASARPSSCPAPSSPR